MSATKRLVFVIDRTYRITFHGQGDREGKTYSVDIQVSETGDNSPSSIRAWIMRWTAFGKNTVEVEEIAS